MAPKVKNQRQKQKVRNEEKLELSSDSDSELELIDCPRHVRRPGIKRRRILDGTNVHAVPIYTGRVSRTLTLYQENPEEVDRAFQRLASEPDSEDDPDGNSELESRRHRRRKRPSAQAQRRGLHSDSEQDEDLNLSVSSSHKDRSPSPPSTPSTPSRRTRRACIAIREADRNLKQLKVFHSSPVNTRVQCESEDVVLVGVLPTVPTTPREITVKVRCRGEIYRIPMRVTEPLQKVIDYLSGRLKVKADRILLLQKDVEVPRIGTPESQNIGVADILDCFVMSEYPAQLTDKICLRVRGVEKNSFQVITIGKTESLKRLMEDYKERMDLQRCRLTFHFDGTELLENSTPQDNEMESDDVIDVRICSS
ncbi:NFATC2-interacting protein isoform X2 [Rhincodon typus]|uniref:NFATC2-interacting protein isoform X2 n=1 Tax=Rhincodon typus TaxID=259920 RepID=UPI00203050A3|nr:NFATC2-interacting protein isoform X2 [Rhincodon typus]